jgi:hypothetical protein
LVEHPYDQGIGEILRHPANLVIARDHLERAGRGQRGDGVIVAAAQAAGGEQDGDGP